MKKKAKKLLVFFGKVYAASGHAFLSEPEKQPKQGGVIRNAKSYECYKVRKVTVQFFFCASQSNYLCS